MSCSELIDSLRKAADERIRGMRREAEKKAEAIRCDAERKLAELREEVNKMRTASAWEQNSVAVAEARTKARALTLSAEKDLSDKLYGIAVSCLPLVRKKNYDTVFGRLAQELPSCDWKSVKVNPADTALAGKYFPSSSAVPDQRISGGMDVATGEGSIRIINTFEKRLERAWRDLLPELIADVWREVSDETPSGAAEPRIPDRVSLVEGQGKAVASDQ